MSEADREADVDPAAPREAMASSDDATERANFGLDGQGDLPDGELEVVEDFGHPASLVIDIAEAHRFLNACMGARPRVHYGLGAKRKPGQEPGAGLLEIDCSGFVREVMRRATSLESRFPDGSVVQHDWVRARGFSKVDRAAGGTMDGAVRIAFLRPEDSPKHIGHVVLLHNGKTLESHGGVGPNQRPWTGQGWQMKAHVYVLMPARLT